jgi:hypothetical protein
MVYGFGPTNYISYPTTHGQNIVGGICNGITAMDTDETNLDWRPYADSDWQNWRWIEQWLPHDAWYLLAVSSLSHLVNYPGKAIVQFSNIEVAAGINGNTISWTSDWEINGMQYVIQKSVDGSAFTSIDTISTTGTESSSTSYNYTDTSSVTGTISYHIVYTDLNGNVLTSTNVSLVVTALNGPVDATGVVAGPNPFSGQIQLKADQEIQSVRITTPTGMVVKELQPNAKELRTGESLEPGMYFAEIKTRGGSKVLKVIKR